MARITLPESKDVNKRNELLKMTEQSLDKDIKRMIKLMNSRLTRLEKSGLVKDAPAYAHVKKWLKENTDNSKTFKFSTVKGSSIQQKANYLAMLYHFEGYKLTVKAAKETRELKRKQAERELGYKPSDEELDRIGDLMAVLYRDSNGIDAIFSEIFTSDEARLWVTEHINITKEDAKKFLQDIKDFVDESNGRLNSQDIKDFIDEYEFGEGNSYYNINGVLVDRQTGSILNKDTHEIIEEYEYDPVGENIYDSNGYIANVDEEGVVIPLTEFLRGKYGYD